MLVIIYIKINKHKAYTMFINIDLKLYFISLDMEGISEVVGFPEQGVQIALSNWEEGNYRVTDKPNPRGEIIIGGPAISTG